MQESKPYRLYHGEELIFEGTQARMRIQILSPHSEVTSNPMLASAMGGGSPEDYIHLPGEHVIGYMVDRSTTITIEFDEGTHFVPTEKR